MTDAKDPAKRRWLSWRTGNSQAVPQKPAAGRAAPVTPSGAEDVAAFVRKMRELPSAATAANGRLIFAMDATMSRQPTWDMALALQGEMFAAVEAVGGLDVQLVYFRGLGECRASRWVSDAGALARLMSKVDCRGGHTQIGKVLTHALAETGEMRVNAVVYVGDCMEESADHLCQRAGELALLGVPVFLFQEGHDTDAEATFREIARLTRGAFCRFDAGAADQLRELLTAVAVYASGGHAALKHLGDGLGTGRRGAHLLRPQIAGR